MVQDFKKSGKRNVYLKSICFGYLAIGILLIIIFLCANRLTYWQGWLFGAVNMIIITILFTVFSELSEVVKDRMKPGEGTKWWDKIFWAIYGPMNLAIVIIASLDAGRFFWSPPFHALLYIGAYILYMFSNAIHLWAIITNEFYVSTVRIQDSEGQSVIQHGPYKYVRHPGYLGISCMLLCIALVLGSLWALLPVAAVWSLLIVRTFLEDKTLHKELPGYFAYAQHVKFRLFPGIW